MSKRIVIDTDDDVPSVTPMRNFTEASYAMFQREPEVFSSASAAVTVSPPTCSFLSNLNHPRLSDEEKFKMIEGECISMYSRLCDDDRRKVAQILIGLEEKKYTAQYTNSYWLGHSSIIKDTAALHFFFNPVFDEDDDEKGTDEHFSLYLKNADYVANFDLVERGEFIDEIREITKVHSRKKLVANLLFKHYPRHPKTEQMLLDFRFDDSSNPFHSVVDDSQNAHDSSIFGEVLRVSNLILDEVGYPQGLGWVNRDVLKEELTKLLQDPYRKFLSRQCTRDDDRIALYILIHNVVGRGYLDCSRFGEKKFTVSEIFTGTIIVMKNFIASLLQCVRVDKTFKEAKKALDFSSDESLMVDEKIRENRRTLESLLEITLPDDDPIDSFVDGAIDGICCSLLEEMKLMDGLCTAGYVGRLVNVFQGHISRFETRMPTDKAINIVLSHYFSKKIREEHENVLLGTEDEQYLPLYVDFVERRVREKLGSIVEEHGVAVLEILPRVLDGLCEGEWIVDEHNVKWTKRE